MIYSSLRLAAFASVVLLAAGCDSDPFNSGGAPAVSYASTTLDADFYQAGSSGSPSIDWNGAQGSISLGADVAGLSVNSTTGRLSWTKLLPPGMQDVEVVFSNSEGQIVVPLVIENQLSGSFEGTYSDAFFFAFDIAEDGTFDVRSDDGTGGGTWQEASDGSFVFDYKYDDVSDLDFHTVANLAQTDAEATLSGEWFRGTSSDSDAERGGTMQISLD